MSEDELKANEWQFPDGKVELTDANVYAGLGNCFSKMNVNSTGVFIRINGGKWIPSFEKSAHRVKLILEKCKSLQEVRNIFKE